MLATSPAPPPAAAATVATHGPRVVTSFRSGSSGSGSSSAPGTGLLVQRPLLSVVVPHTDDGTAEVIVPLHPTQDSAALLLTNRAASPDVNKSSAIATNHKGGPRVPAEPNGPNVSTTATMTPLFTPSPVGASPSVPMLHLSLPPCADEVAPVRTLYNRLFREAQEREQRQRHAQERRRAEQQEREKETRTFKPHVQTGHTALCEADEEASCNPDSNLSPPRWKGSVGARDTSSAGADVIGETAACERLYRNLTEQAERRERRLQALRDAQEAEFAAQCTFRPCVAPLSGEGREGRSGSAARQGGRQSSTPARRTQQEQQHDNGTSAAAGSSPSPSARHRTPSRSWQGFLAAQEEMQSLREHRLAVLRRRAEEESRPGLYTGVPRSKASRHLRRYLEKGKQYKGPIEGWSAHYAHYAKARHLPGAAVLDAPADDIGGRGAEEQAPTPPSHTTPSPSHPHSTANGAGAKPTLTNATTRTTSSTTTPSTRAANAAAVAPVFERLFRDGTERVAVRKLVRLMKEQCEHEELYKPNAAHADPAAAALSPSSARTPCTGPRQTSSSAPHTTAATSRNTSHAATAAAIALAAGGDMGVDNSNAACPPEGQLSAAPAASVFEALHAEKMELQRRRELRHLQAETKAETFSFRPSLDAHSRTLVAERARRQSDGEAVPETVRERRARAEADAAAAEAARRAQIHFSSSAFAHRQAERDRGRQEELLMLLLQERRDDVGECRFRPALSETTEELVEGHRTYTQIIDSGPLAYHTRSPSPASAVRGPRGAVSPRAGVANGRSAVRPTAPAGSVPVKASRQRTGAGAATASTPEELGQPVFNSAAAFPTMPSLSPPAQGREALAADLEDNLHGSVSAAYSAATSERQAPLVTSHAPSSKRSNVASASPEVADEFSVDASATSADDGIALGPMRVAGAASSTYLRHLESELQDALRDWSQRH